ncbi:superoxide dismutase family protein [Sporosarcina saromensis]|uniref:Superoxide dismutase [Cu-Zn] n=1 Tax=Sporosarcina saromensis TaxID=359365 RepID=A0ABU4G664_9BACL|nr:superoxide dismutase family protein [Sporosarcina saromensis]MDW0112458.1 superoxide dismutase family protein [Sporosarcina saromensis]
MRNYARVVPTVILALGLAACGDEKPKVDENAETGLTETEPMEGEYSTSVELIGNEGESVGAVELIQKEDGVMVKLQAEGLPPGPHGIHFHEKGTCETPDFESAGGHFNPTDASHGLEHDEGPHAGDLPNIEVNEDGTIDTEFLAKNVTLTLGDDNSLLQEGGTALVIHAGEDDGKSQPSGDSGERIVCGEIK